MKLLPVFVSAIALNSLAVLADPEAAAQDAKVVTTTVYGTTTNTHKYGKFNKTKKSSTSSSTGTHKYGRFNKTKKSSSSSSTGTHKYGKFNKTKKSSTSTSTGTHKYGKFNKTKKSSTSTSTGTHKYGRFNKTKKSSSSSSTGTHKYGKFNKTKKPTTTTVYVAETKAAQGKDQAVLASNSTSTTVSSVSSGEAPASGVYGLSLGLAAVGAIAVLL